MPRTESTCRELAWTDIDGDRIRLSWDDAEQVGRRAQYGRGCIQIFDGETDCESAVYMDEQDALRIIAWLQACLAGRGVETEPLGSVDTIHKSARPLATKTDQGQRPGTGRAGGESGLRPIREAGQ